MNLAKILSKHRPQVNLKSYCSEVFQCGCGLSMKKFDKDSWKEWELHVAEVVKGEINE